MKRGFALTTLWSVFSVGLVAPACSSANIEPGGGYAGTAGQGAGGSPAQSGSGGSPAGGSSEAVGGAATHDGSGYAIVGRDLYPPLYHRVEAMPCPESPRAECIIDADCGSGMACACRNSRGACVPAECLSDADCAEGLCLLSEGPDDECCGSSAMTGLYCERRASTCVDGGDCPGNGQACVYISDTDRFECWIRQCGDCPT